jgi:ferredoxin
MTGHSSRAHAVITGAEAVDFPAPAVKNDGIWIAHSEDLVAEEATLDVARFVDGDIEKCYPISEGDTKQRKRKPHIVAVINEMCTGCSGSPACVDYCPVAACMFWVPDSEHPPFGRIMVDPILCIGCKLCTSKGPDGAFLEGCPWDAIDMVPLAEFEAKYGSMPF